MADVGFRMLPCASKGVYAVVAHSRHEFSRHTHDQFGIGAIAAGGQKWHSGRGEVEAGPGAAIAVNPGEVHDGAPIGDSGRTWRMLYFDPAVVGAAAVGVFGGRPGAFEISQPVMGDSRVTDIVLRLLEAETTGSEALRCEGLLLAMVARAGEFRSPLPHHSTAVIAQAKSRIDDDPAEPVTLAELAAMSGMSRFKLLRVFTQVTGLTPHAYLLQRRIDIVRGLILDGVSLSAAAAAAGFSDQSHMTRTFVRKYGFTPGVLARVGRASSATKHSAAGLNEQRGRLDVGA